MKSERIKREVPAEYFASMLLFEQWHHKL